MPAGHHRQHEDREGERPCRPVAQHDRGPGHRGDMHARHRGYAATDRRSLAGVERPQIVGINRLGDRRETVAEPEVVVEHRPRRGHEELHHRRHQPPQDEPAADRAHVLARLEQGEADEQSPRPVIDEMPVGKMEPADVGPRVAEEEQRIEIGEQPVGPHAALVDGHLHAVVGRHAQPRHEGQDGDREHRSQGLEPQVTIERERRDREAGDPDPEQHPANPEMVPAEDQVRRDAQDRNR